MRNCSLYGGWKRGCRRLATSYRKFVVDLSLHVVFALKGDVMSCVLRVIKTKFNVDSRQF